MGETGLESGSEEGSLREGGDGGAREGRGGECRQTSPVERRDDAGEGKALVLALSSCLAELCKVMIDQLSCM